MSVTLALALVLQVTGVILLRRQLGRRWLRRPVTLLYLAAVVNDGVSAVLLAFPSVAAQDPYRSGVEQGYTDDATLILSGAMLALVVAYLLTQPQRELPSVGDIPVVGMPDWRLLALACAPLAVLTYEGKGYNDGASLTGGTPLATDLAATFFTVLVIVTALSIVMRYGQGWFLPVLAGQSLALAAAGERTPVLAGAIALVLMLAHAGMRPPARQLHAAVALTAMLILAITGARVVQGRGLYETASGFGARAQALGAGITAAPGAPGLIAEAADRMDGDAFAGAVLQAEFLGHPRLNAAYVPESLLEVVPSVLWPSKLGRGNSLNPAQMEIGELGLQNINFLPGLPGLYAGFLSTPWLVIFLAFLGAVFGLAERWLLRRCTPARLVLLAGAVTAALGYQGGLPAMLVTVRAAVVIAVAVKAADGLGGLSRRRALPDCAPLLLPRRDHFALRHGIRSASHTRASAEGVHVSP